MQLPGKSVLQFAFSFFSLFLPSLANLAERLFKVCFDGRRERGRRSQSFGSADRLMALRRRRAAAAPSSFVLCAGGATASVACARVHAFELLIKAIDDCIGYNYIRKSIFLN